jgi:hypothetical protein
LANTCIFVSGRIIVQQKKSREQKSSFRIRRTTVLGCSKILLSFLMRFDGHF